MTRRPDFLKAGLLTCTLLSGLPVCGAQAQEQPAGARPASSEGDQLVDIVVTARRREESLQNAPVAVTALSGRMLEERNVTKLSDVQSFAPNLTFNSTANISGSNDAASVFIRGIGQTDFSLTTDPGVGIFVDGVYVSRGVGGTIDLVDIERVEVLKGPQGTLFGKNTIGGAISITTVEPAKTFGGSVKLARGRFGRFEAKASIDIPLSDTVFTKFTGSSIRSDGYVRRIGLPTPIGAPGIFTPLQKGVGLGDDNSISGRADVLVRPSDRFSARLVFEITRKRENGSPLVAVAINPNSQFNQFWNSAIAPLLQPTLGQLAFFNEQYLTGSPYRTYATAPSASDLDLKAGTLTLDYKFSDSIAIKSISAWRDVQSYFTRDFDHSPLEHSPSFNVLGYRTLSQEFQLGGEAFGRRLNWLLGAFYFNERGSDNNSPRFPVVAIRSGGRVRNESVGIFAHSSLDVTDRFSLSGGVRYSHEIVRFRPDQVVLEVGRLGVPALIPNLVFSDFTVNPPVFVPVQVGDRVLPFIEASQRASKLTPQVSAQYHWTPSVMTYASYSKGFKNGGFTQRVFPPRPDIPSYAPEQVDAFEVGLKSTLFNRRLRLDIAAFSTNYHDIQEVINDGVAPTIRNAAEGRVRGFEVETTAQLAHGLQWNAAVGYTNAKFLKLDSRAAPLGLTLNSKFPKTPDWSLSSSLSYNHDLGRIGSLTWRGDWSYRSTVYNDAVNSASIRQPGVHLFNASLTYATTDDAWSVGLSVKNLTDRHYIISGYDDLAVNGIAEAAFAPPREWLVTAAYHF